MVWVFPGAGVEDHVRATTVPRGETPTTVTPDDTKSVREAQKYVIEFPEGNHHYA